MKLAWSLVAAVILTLACGVAAAQSQNESLGDYARAVKKTKPESGADASKVYDNDNLPAVGTVSIVGSQSAQSDDSKDQSADDKAQSADKTADASADKAQDQSTDKTQDASDSDANKTDAKPDSADADKPKEKKDDFQLKPGQSDEDRDKALAALKTRLAAQRDKVSLLTRELDVLKSEYNLKATQFYNDAVRRAENQTGLIPDDAKYKQQIADKQKALDEANAELTDMQDQARRQGAPDSALE